MYHRALYFDWRVPFHWRLQLTRSPTPAAALRLCHLHHRRRRRIVEANVNWRNLRDCSLYSFRRNQHSERYDSSRDKHVNDKGDHA